MDFINYLLEQGYCNTLREAEIIESVASDYWYYSIIEEKRPISLPAREQIVSVADSLGSGRFSRDPKKSAQAKKLLSRLNTSDRKRMKGELPVGRMANKIRGLIQRPRRTGADKESDFSRAEHLSSVLKDLPY